MRVTRYVITSPECTDILPWDISTMIYESRRGIDIKETCFGAIIEGDEDAIKSVVEEIRGLDPYGIFIKDRGFPLGDPRHCRGYASVSPSKIISITSGRRSGSVRPGCYMIEAESKMLPMISRALASLEDKKSETDMKMMIP
jgi:putative methanogenesis marker protein 6